jgi:hypothetical protein
MSITHPQPTDAATPAPRMTLSRVVELALQRGGHTSSSVTLTRNAKGETQIEVVVRTGENPLVETIAHAEDSAGAVYDRLRARYPLLSESTAGEAS